MPFCLFERLMDIIKLRDRVKNKAVIQTNLLH